jgi:hypothetical protein
VYRDTCPDIIGCQEASALMADLLKDGFENIWAIVRERYRKFELKRQKHENIQ